MGRTAAHRHKKGRTWIEYWKRGDSSSETVSKHNMNFFLKATSKIMQFNAEDIVLDIGCGYCHLAEALRDRVREIHCVDISEFYLERCKVMFAGAENVFFHKLSENNYTDLGVLGRVAFSKIVCLSVVQYYRGIEEIERLILAVDKVAANGAEFLIADIPVSKPGCKEAFKTIVYAGMNGKFTDSCLLFVKGLTGAYRRVSREVGLLTLSVAQIKEMGERFNLNFKILEDQLTINPGRVHLVIKC